eukprot:127227-Hanusia_phi.AAC.3
MLAAAHSRGSSHLPFLSASFLKQQYASSCGACCVTIAYNLLKEEEVAAKEEEEILREVSSK